MYGDALYSFIRCQNKSPVGAPKGEQQKGILARRKLVQCKAHDSYTT